MSEPPAPNKPTGPPEPTEPPRPANPLRDRWLWVVGGAILAALALAIPIILFFFQPAGENGDGPAETTIAGSGTSASPTTTASRQRGRITTTTSTTLPAEAVDRNPLTGEPLASPTSARIVAVKVDNAPQAKPQIGIGEAEMLIEIPVEGGLTRFTGFYFETVPALVGPVRSVRPVDADILAPFRPLLVSTGGRDFVMREHRAAGIGLVDDDVDRDLFQTLERPAPDNLFLDGAAVEPRRGGSPAIEPLRFGAGPLASAATATTVHVPFSGVVDVEWEYDGERWVRSENGARHLVLGDLESAPEALAFDTVVVLSVAQRSAGYTDTAGADVPTFDVIGFGDAVIAHGGSVVTGEWRRAAQEEGFRFFDDSGAEVLVPPGTVMIEIVPRFVQVEIR